jgi:phospholipid/cholesterol/gamma-HCH transport system substrate-binding protein
MENKAHALAAGLFTLLLGAALAATGVWFSKKETQLSYYVMFTTGSVTGLKVEAPVRYRGVDVGRVTGLALEPGNTGRVRIEIGVQENTPVTTSTYAQLGFQGVTGLAYVQLNDDGKAQEKLANVGSMPQLRMKPSLMDDGESLFATLSEIADKVGNVLNKENQEKLNSALAGVEQLTQRAVVVARKAEPALDALPGLLAEARGLTTEARASLKRVDQLTSDAGKLIATSNQLALKLDQKLGVVDQIAATAKEAGVLAQGVNDESLPRVNALVDEVSRQTRAMDRVINNVNTLTEQPQSVVFGPPPARPGPGEPGFSAGK